MSAIAWIALILMAVGAGGAVARRRRRVEVYRGIEHPQGPLELLLLGDGRFVMTLSIWDPVVGALIGDRTLVGRWRHVDDTLELRSATRHIVYRRSDGGDAEWAWRRSDLPTFADGIALARRHDHQSPRERS